MNHPLHPHPMRLKSEEIPFECSGCKEPGFGPRYQCVQNCHFFLHVNCFNARPTDASIIHPFMGNCRFQFLWEPPGGSNSRFCDACGQGVRGFLYHDKDKHKLDLHPCCMNLKSTMSDPYGRMVLTLKGKMPSKCVKCERKDLNVMAKRPFRGWSYVSSCGNYCYHVYCVKKLVIDNWERGCFNNIASSSSSLSSSRGEIMFGDEITGSMGLARRVSSPSRSSFTRKLIKMAKVGFHVIISIISGDPTSLLAAFGENLFN